MVFFDSPIPAHESLKWLEANIASGKAEIEDMRSDYNLAGFGKAALRPEGMISWGLYDRNEIERWIEYAQGKIDEFWNIMERA